MKNIGRAEGDRRLSYRRRRSRLLGRILFLALICALLGSGVWLTNQPQVRIAHVEIIPDNPMFASIARSEMEGKYVGLIPRDSIFFFPERMIRARILAAYPEIAAISIQGNGLTGISVHINERVPLARWCGLKKTPEPVPEYCYLFDSSGFIYAAADVASTTQPINAFVLYAPLQGVTEEPLRATLANMETLPRIFDFARELTQFDGVVTHITIREDEIDCLLASGTRVTYVRGQEEKAFAALMSSRQNLNLSDGSLEYVDVRFDGKVYLKRKE